MRAMWAGVGMFCFVMSVTFTYVTVVPPDPLWERMATIAGAFLLGCAACTYAWKQLSKVTRALVVILTVITAMNLALVCIHFLS